MLLIQNNTNAQNTDTLKEVKVKAKSKTKSNDVKLNSYTIDGLIIPIDQQTLRQYEFQDMANLLSQQVPVFIKSYGLNNIATLNFRGASAAQSQVYWNGVPVQNAALGIADVSLLPVALMNRVNVVYSSSSALWGSGNVGGAVMLENDLPRFNDSSHLKQSVSAVAASFGHYRIGFKSEYTSKRFAMSANLFGQSTQNNFRYIDNNVEKRMSNARLQSGVALLQGSYKINSYNKITARGWYQQYYREIPRALFESASYKNQKDESVRIMLDWERRRRVYTYAKTAFIRDYVHFQDSTVLLKTNNIANQLYTEVGIEPISNRQHKLLLFSPVSISWMDSRSNAGAVNQSKYALATAYSFNTKNRRLIASASGRAEVVDDKSYFLPGLNLSYRLFNSVLSIHGNVQRTYRVPTLNELYYTPGGNPNLKPEYGWNTEVGYTAQRSRYKQSKNDDKTGIVVDIRKLSLSHSLSFYNRVIHNWILWFGGAIWTPHNIATVHSRGLQTENKAQYNISNKFSVRVSVSGGYTVATTVASDIPGDGSIGKQIPYTPLYNGQANVGGTYKKLYLNYNHSYTGLRYITTDESFGLAAHGVGNLQAMYHLGISGKNLRLTAQCNNIWNKTYQVVNARPMPGINWLIGLGFSF